MTKYIDRYYLNGELYGIKFASPGWQPGANTIAYYPFDTDINDYSGNNHNLTAVGTFTVGTYNGVDCVYSNGGHGEATISSLPQSNSARTVSFFVNGNGYDKGLFCWGASSAYKKFAAYLGKGPQTIWVTNYAGFDLHPSNNLTQNVWHHIVVTADSSAVKIYVDSVLSAELSNPTLNTEGTTLSVAYADRPNRPLDGYLGRFILEDKVWSAQEIADYYNQTKSLYGIS